MTHLRSIAGFASFAIMAACGFLISWQLRNQHTHATPSAIFIACALSSVLAGYLGWRLSSLYNRRPKFALIAFPATILATTSFATAVIYVLVQPAFREWEYWPMVLSESRGIPSYAAWYIVFSAIIWLPAFLVATFVFRRVAEA